MGSDRLTSEEGGAGGGGGGGGEEGPGGLARGLVHLGRAHGGEWVREVERRARS
jgi:hypothetical protein